MDVHCDDLVHSGHLEHPRCQLRCYRLPLIGLLVISSAISGLDTTVLLFADKCIEFIHIDLLSSSLSKKWINANLFDKKKVLFTVDVLY